MLSSNRLQRIEGLSTLTSLATLWVCDNNVTSLHGLESLVSLKELWACRNHIQHLGNTLSKNTDLQELNLADNGIGCFKEIWNLCSLQSLTSLALSDQHYGLNPVCSLCNYQTLVIFHLGQLTRFDMGDIDIKTRHTAQSIFLKKRMYYNMRIRTLKRYVQKT